MIEMLQLCILDKAMMAMMMPVNAVTVTGQQVLPKRQRVIVPAVAHTASKSGPGESSLLPRFHRESFEAESAPWRHSVLSSVFRSTRLADLPYLPNRPPHESAPPLRSGPMPRGSRLRCDKLCKRPQMMPLFSGNKRLRASPPQHAPLSSACSKCRLG